MDFARRFGVFGGYICLQVVKLFVLMTVVVEW